VLVLALYVLLVLTPAAAFWVAGKGLERLAVPRRRTSSSGRPVGRSLERLMADLRRLEEDYRRIEASDLPGRGARMRTVSLAYDDTLRACCRAVGLPAPATTPLSALARLETEAALAQHGVTW
jgi:hypothetical protein